MKESIIQTEDDFEFLKDLVRKNNKYDFTTVKILDIESKLAFVENRICQIEYRSDNVNEVVRDILRDDILAFKKGYRYPLPSHLVKDTLELKYNDNSRLPFIGSELVGKVIVTDLILRNNPIELYSNRPSLINVYNILKTIEDIGRGYRDTLIELYGLDMNIFRDLYLELDKFNLRGKIIDLDLSTINVRVMVSNDILIHYCLRNGILELDI